MERVRKWRIRAAVFVAAVWMGVASAEAAVSFQNETLKYVITYKWGVIHKEAGDATLSLRRTGDKYDLKLVAKSRPWIDHFYSVRDTLLSSIRVSDMKPIIYEKRVNEKNSMYRDRVEFHHSAGKTLGTVTKFRTNKDGSPKVEEYELSSTGPTYDMLSIFYYLRKLDYSQLDKYKSYMATVFSGDMKESVKIKSLGKEKLTMRDKTVREAYHIRFNFTQKGGKKSSDDIDAWISTDSSHIPLYLVGRLPVGEVRVYLQQ